MLRINGIRKREFEKLSIIRDTKVELLNLWLQERVNDLRLISQNPEIINLGKELQSNPGDISEEQIFTVSNILNKHVDLFSYSQISFISLVNNKTIISTSAEAIGSDATGYIPYIKAVKTMKPFIADIYYPDLNKESPRMAISIPVFSSEADNKHILGAIVVTIDIADGLNALIKQNAGLGHTGETVIVNIDKRPINKLTWLPNAPLTQVIEAEPAIKAAEGQTGTAETQDYRGKKVLASYTYIPSTKWGLIVKRDYDDIFSPLKKDFLNVLFVLIMMVIIVALVSICLGKSIAQPLAQIKKNVNKFINGDLNARCEVEGDDEISELARDLNTMTEKLSFEITVRNGANNIAETMVDADNVELFAQTLLDELIEQSDAQFGGFYIMENGSNDFKLISSVGLNEKAPRCFSNNIKEGEMGRALTSGKISVIRNISRNTDFTLKTTVGTMIPNEIMTIPIVVEDKITALVSLAKLSSFKKSFYNIVQEEMHGMNTTLGKLLSEQVTQLLNEELSAKNQELQAQTTELEQQALELQQQTEELQQQAEELRNQQKKVEEANRLKSEFLSNMSHELRTPLNSVLSLSQLMLSDSTISENENNKERIEIIERNGKHLLSLINDILDLSKIEAGKMDLFVQRFSLKELVNSVVDIIRPIAAEKSIEINVVLDPEITELQSDRDKIKQILLNLLSNAQKFTHKGHIDLITIKSDKFVKIQIKDTGIGIPQNALDHIFEEFRQVDGSTTRRYGGTGLGLAICKKLANILGGTISVESQLQKGSTFEVSIPIELNKNEINPVPPNKTGSNTNADENRTFPKDKTPHVLIVEDNKIARDQVKRIMLAENFTVEIAENGEQALKITEERIPDAMILDLMMPEVDGFQVIEAIRSNPATDHIPILVLTAKDLTTAECADLNHHRVQLLIQKGNLDRNMLVNNIKQLIGIQASNTKAEITNNSSETEKEEKSSKKIVLEKNKKLSILIAEDYVDNLTTTIAIIETFLEDIPKVILKAENGKEALEIAEKEHPDIILMDMQMPVMGGFEAIQHIRKNPKLKDIVIIALTASAMTGDKENILNAGCDDYLSKPVKPAKISNTIRKWVAKS